MSLNNTIYLNIAVQLHHLSDDDSSECGDEAQNLNNKLTRGKTSTRSSPKRKRSFSSKKSKTDVETAKRFCSDHSTDLIDLDGQRIDGSAIMSCLKDLNENNKLLLRQQRQIMLTQDRIERSQQLLLKNQKRIAKAMNKNKVCITRI